MPLCLQGLCRCVKEQLKDPVSVVRLWSHECERVMADRLISLPDLTKFGALRVNASKKFFEEVPQVGCWPTLEASAVLDQLPCVPTCCAAMTRSL